MYLLLEVNTQKLYYHLNHNMDGRLATKKSNPLWLCFH